MTSNKHSLLDNKVLYFNSLWLQDTVYQVFLVSHFTTIVYLKTEEAAPNNTQYYRILLMHRQIQNTCLKLHGEFAT